MEGGLILLFSIFCSAALFIIFRYYPKFKVKSSNAIVINYVVAATLSFSYYGKGPQLDELFSTSWGNAALLLGFLFITLFNLIAYTSHKIGITPTTVANKTTFIVPVFIGMIVFSEPYNWLTILGLVSALIAIFFSAKKKSDQINLSKTDSLWILVLFIGGGVLDGLLGYSQTALFPKEASGLFVGYIFLVAGFFGMIHLIFQLVRRKTKINLRDTIGGVALGIPNFGSIYFFLLSMSYPGWNSSIAFPVSNMGIIVLASILSRILFKEEINRYKQLAIFFAVIAIAFVGFNNEILELLDYLISVK
jgi:drug/metabolite transporter (DMT)-like permease